MVWVQNPGGTLAPTGGYVIGRRHYVDAAFKRLSAPGVEGGEKSQLYSFCALFPRLNMMMMMMVIMMMIMMMMDAQVRRWDRRSGSIRASS